MKCHYEVLCIPRDSDDAAIKTAYRKLALRWHPDKNPNNLDVAKEQFQIVQQAYDVLSDPQERAWYDNHREQILRGSHTDYQDNSIDVYQYFTATCYKGFEDDECGFYTVYRQIFERIASEDIEFIDDKDEFKAIPTFGTSTSNYDEIVGPFYAYWLSYCTKKTYAWLCPHNVSEIRDRRILREIEKQTKKISQKARKERNDEIRALVAFVKKRDKRVIERRKQLEEKAAQNRIKQKEKRLEQLKRNQNELKEMGQQREGELYSTEHKLEEQLRLMEETYASSSSEDETNNLNGIKNNLNVMNLEDISADDLIDNLYCVACNKAFKNESSFKNHETSKRHKENIEKLKTKMRDEDELVLNDSQSSSDDDEVSRDDSRQDSANDNSDQLTDDEIVQVEKENRKISTRNKLKKKKVINNIQPEDCPELFDISKEKVYQNDWDDAAKKAKKSQKSKKQIKIDKKLSSVATSTASTTSSQKNSNLSTSESENPSNSNINQTDLSLTCAICKSTFPSKNRLFTHLKATKHEIYIDKENLNGSVAAGQSHRKIKKKQFYSKVTL